MQVLKPFQNSKQSQQSQTSRYSIQSQTSRYSIQSQTSRYSIQSRHSMPRIVNVNMSHMSHLSHTSRPHVMSAIPAIPAIPFGLESCFNMSHVVGDGIGAFIMFYSTLRWAYYRKQREQYEKDNDDLKK